MGLSLVTSPTEAEILSLLSIAQLKDNLRITHSYEDEVAKECILAAYDWLANPEYGWLNRSVLTQTLKMTLPGFQKQQVYTSSLIGGPATKWVATNTIELPRPVLRTVTSVKYLSSAAQSTLDPAGYVVTTDSLVGTITLASGASWPTSIDTNPGAVEIVYTAGFGDAAYVRRNYRGIVQALKLLASDAFRNREDTYAEPRLVAVNRKIVNGVIRYAGRYQIKNNYA